MTLLTILLIGLITIIGLMIYNNIAKTNIRFYNEIDNHFLEVR